MKTQINQTLKIILLTLIGVSLAGCTVKETTIIDSSAGAFAALSAHAIEVTNANSSQCPSGGSVYTVFADKDKNGIYDSTEVILSQQNVCNGQDGVDGTNGTNGFSMLFSMTRVQTNSQACASLSGLQIDSGLDTNRSGTLQASEIGGSKILCDGAAGATGANGQAGAAGPAGSNGYSMVFLSTPASPQQCSAGGSYIVMALDSDRSGTYTNADTSQQSLTLCNGATGATGADGTDGEDGSDAEVPAYTPVQPITPCGNTVANKEILLRLSNGEVLASFSDNTQGKMTRLVLVEDGTYMNTDNTSCKFTLATSQDGKTRSISWFNQVQMTWNLSN
ncbi:MAG: hypothetical protein V4692_12470 [Bdellovibrionota bacterium]